MTTIDWYNRYSEKYKENIKNVDISFLLEKFLSYLPKGSSILDAGCGTGRDSFIMKKKGYSVTAFDGSYKMVEIAKKNTHLDVLLGTFEEIQFPQNSFDGIWAIASLLHVDKKNMQKVYAKFYQFLKEDGYFFCSYHLKEEDYYDAGRKFTCYTEKSFRDFIAKTGFDIVYLEVDDDERMDYQDRKWINCILYKKGGK